MQAQPGETRAVFLRAETKAFRNRNVSGLDPNDRTLIIRVKVLTCRFLLLFARFGEPTEVFHTRALSCFKGPYTSVSAPFCAFKRTTNFLPSNSLHKNSCDHHDHFLITNSSTIFPQTISKTCKLKLTTKNAA